MKIIDGVLFSGEIDILELRLRELDTVVDRFVISEASTTFQGRPKRVVLDDYSDRLAPWWDRITHVVVDDLPSGDDCWAREHFQRNTLKRGLTDLRPDDLFLLSDIDEIPTIAAIRACRPMPVSVIAMTMHSFAVDWQYPTPWRGTVACYGRDLNDLSVLRYARNRDDYQTIEGGRHFTWLGDQETKVRSFSHAELVEPILTFGLDRYRTEGIHVDGTQMAPVDVDETWPAWIWERQCPQQWFRPR